MFVEEGVNRVPDDARAVLLRRFVHRHAAVWIARWRTFQRTRDVYGYSNQRSGQIHRTVVYRSSETQHWMYDSKLGSTVWNTIQNYFGSAGESPAALHRIQSKTKRKNRKEIIKVNPFATGDAHMHQLFHCLQWYAGSERVNVVATSFTQQTNTIWAFRTSTGWQAGEQVKQAGYIEQAIRLCGQRLAFGTGGPWFKSWDN